jgi:hypothetical protein
LISQNEAVRCWTFGGPATRLGLREYHQPTDTRHNGTQEEDLPGRRRISRIIKTEMPTVVCFIGKAAYEKYIRSKNFTFGWQGPINKSRIFVMLFPLRREAVIRTRELRRIVRAAHKQ